MMRGRSRRLFSAFVLLLVPAIAGAQCGATWHPASGPVRIDLLPGPPLATQVATSGSVKAIYR